MKGETFCTGKNLYLLLIYQDVNMIFEARLQSPLEELHFLALRCCLHFSALVSCMSAVWF